MGVVKMMVMEQAEQVWVQVPRTLAGRGKPGREASNKGRSLSVLSGAQVRPGWAERTAHAPG